MQAPHASTVSRHIETSSLQTWPMVREYTWHPIFAVPEANVASNDPTRRSSWGFVFVWSWLMGLEVVVDGKSNRPVLFSFQVLSEFSSHTDDFRFRCDHNRKTTTLWDPRSHSDGWNITIPMFQ